jgi:hypothetical protein
LKEAPVGAALLAAAVCSEESDAGAIGAKLAIFFKIRFNFSACLFFHVVLGRIDEAAQSRIGGLVSVDAPTFFAAAVWSDDAYTSPVRAEFAMLKAFWSRV